MWHPELVGEVPYYPKTQEKFDALVEKARALSARMRAEGKWDHRGVPTGMGRRKAEVIAIRAQADIEAREIVKAMAEQGLIDDEAIGNEALMAAVSVIRAKTPDGVHLTPLRERLTAMRLVMEFTKSKPVNKTEVKLETAEDFLAALATKK